MPVRGMTAVLPEPRTPAHLPMAALRNGLAASDREDFGRIRRTSKLKKAHRRPPTLLDLRAEGLAAKVDQTKPIPSRPDIFTAEFVEAQGGAKVARILNACYYDLIQAELR